VVVAFSDYLGSYGRLAWPRSPTGGTSLLSRDLTTSPNNIMPKRGNRTHTASGVDQVAGDVGRYL
jgi:hypothetical protein